MAEFLEERLPVDVRMGATYADEYAVEIVKTKGGSEYPRLLNPFPERNFVVNYTLGREDLWARVIALYHRAFGTFARFRVRCADDYSTNGNKSPPTAVDQTMSLVSAGVYQLQKFYGLGGTPISIGYPVRTIFKPVAGTVRVSVNAVEVFNWTVNTTTGRITFSAPIPSGGDVVQAGCEFDLPCRFNSRIDIQHISHNVREAGSIDIVEVLNP